MANEIEARIRAEAKKLLESSEVTLVIGWEAGSVPFKTSPAFIESPEDVERLVWNPACTNNLAVYLTEVAKRARVGIVVKPCDSRSIVTLVQEKQISRENVTIIGVTCPGIVDDTALKKAGVRLIDVLAVDWNGDSFNVTTGSGKSSVLTLDAVKEGCRTCAHRAPVISDVSLGEMPDANPLPVEPMEGSFSERREYWANEFERCIRCYACRQICPACYCTKCFADRNDLKWTNKHVGISDNWMWHMGRAMHLAGRCIGCGECERACPMDLPMMKLNREFARHVEELFGYTPGMDPEELPVLGQFNYDDKDPNGH
ncbi:MAG: 4Fe-4S dicluster domain-containing protein [Armatimonadetes bacterium]|nr:4Fe-4S dicluster domain-containing protein [Armatimonadota bacterium]